MITCITDYDILEQKMVIIYHLFNNITKISE